MAGFMGRVEFGSKTGSQFPAGRSYHGVDRSPCVCGITKGTALAALLIEFAMLAAWGSFWAELPGDGVSSMAARSFATKESGKYSCSSHNAIKS